MNIDNIYYLIYYLFNYRHSILNFNSREKEFVLTTMVLGLIYIWRTPEVNLHSNSCNF